MIATLTLNPSIDELVLLPRLRLGTLNRAREMRRYPGGKGINVSRVVHELGSPTIAYGLIGGDDGEVLEHLLTRLGVAHRFVHIPAPTRNNFQIQTPQASTQINTPGPRVSAGALRLLTRSLGRWSPRPQVLVISGSLPPGVPSTYCRDLIRLARRSRIPVALDTHGPPLRRGLAAKPWLIKPNLTEAEQLLGRRLRTVRAVGQAARRLAQGGIAAVVISLGRHGAVLATQALSTVWHASSPRVRVRSAVGAGDALVGALVTAFTRGQSLLEALRWGVAAGAASAATPGTELCHRTEVRRLVRQVTVRIVPIGRGD
ncbi:MAG: 1-phosphofructokinase [Candidatus Omnitrophica bacterium]|nr:1-phosphofructokinase [Candidatus Omnitrophota bacterium]